ncbi:MAG: rhomboid family intramembrane serine protease [Opitutales bacterium]
MLVPRERLNVTILISGIVGILLIFFLQVAVGPNWVLRFGTVPAEVRAGWNTLTTAGFDLSALSEVLTLFSATLIHGGVEHVFFNLLYLWIFAFLVMQALGPVWGAGIFVVTGVVGNLTQCFFEWDSTIPIVGASGAVMGFEGVYLGLFLRFRLRDPDVWPIAHPIPPFNLLLLTVFGTVADVTGIVGGGQGIAYGAHLGGLVSGLFIGSFIVPKVREESLRDHNW